MQARETDLRGALVPLGRAPEVAPAEDATAFAREDQSVGFRLGELVEALTRLTTGRDDK